MGLSMYGVRGSPGESRGDVSPIRASTLRRAQVRVGGGARRGSLGGDGGVCKIWSMGVIGEQARDPEGSELRRKKPNEKGSLVGVRLEGVADAGHRACRENTGGGILNWHWRAGMFRSMRRRDIEGFGVGSVMATRRVFGVLWDGSSTPSSDKNPIATVWTHLTADVSSHALRGPPDEAGSNVQLLAGCRFELDGRGHPTRHRTRH